MKISIENIIAELTQNGKPFAVAIIVKSTGSTPRHVGAKMVIVPKSTEGTIGGGELEFQVIEDSRNMLLKKVQSECKTYNLPACGGTVEVFIETKLPGPTLLIFGAGHVSKAVTPLAITCGFSVNIFDERSELLNQNEFKNAKTINQPFANSHQAETNDEAYILIMTPNHKHDEEVLRICLKKDYKYLGMMSSKTKWQNIKKRLITDDFQKEKVESIHAPVGLNINSETPAEIAVSILAELIKIRSKS